MPAICRSILHTHASVPMISAITAACTLHVTAPLEQPAETWDRALNTHPGGPAFQELLDRYVLEGIPGTVLFVRTSAGVWNGAAGFAKIETAESMLPTHLHHAASVTKMYTATAVMLLAEVGIIDLDAAVSEYLPDSVHSRIPNGSDATVRQLLNHTSGIPDFSGNLAYDLDFMSNPLGEYPPERLLSYLYGQSAWSSPGSHFFYSNANYYLLALIMDRLVDGGHAEVFSERIFRPLGLNGTYYENETGYPAPPGIVNSYEDIAGDGRLMNVTDMATHNAGLFVGNAGLIASSADYAAFLEALLEGELVGPESVAHMQDWGVLRYGLGLNYSETPFGPAVGHTGGDFGAMCQVRHFVDADATLVLLMNGGDGGITARLFWRLWEEAMLTALEDL